MGFILTILVCEEVTCSSKITGGRQCSHLLSSAVAQLPIENIPQEMESPCTVRNSSMACCLKVNQPTGCKVVKGKHTAFGQTAG